jgi:hypothetical protein
LDGVCGDPKTEGHIVVSIRRCIFDQHELFQKIETNDPAVDLEVAAVNAGRNDRKLIMSSVWGAVGFSACVDVAAPRLIASAARVAFFMTWFPEISISDNRAPTEFSEVHQFAEGDVFRQGRKPIFGRFFLPFGPLDQQPLFGPAFREKRA